MYLIHVNCSEKVFHLENKIVDIRQLIDDKPTENGILLNQRQWEYIQRLRQLINQHIRRTNNLWMK
jgi:hypothetical protein